MSFQIQLIKAIHGGWQYAVSASEKFLSFDQFYAGLLYEECGRHFFTEFLQNAPFDAYFWETPPVTLERANRPFEFVLMESNALKKVKGDATPFANQFYGKVDDVVTFSNLGKDATLIVPTPTSNLALFPHLAVFVRSAKQSQIDAVWIALANAYQQNLSRQPLWISTAGLGVPWLHIRLDNQPKYYRHQEYVFYR